MQQSRRQLIGILSVTVPFGIAGCTELGSLGSSTEDSESPDNEDSASPDGEEASATIDLTVVVSGPDGEQLFFEADDISRVGSVYDRDQSGYLLPVTLTDDGTTNAIEAFRDAGAAEAPEEATITHTIDGDVEIEETFDVAPSLAEVITTGEWDGQFTLLFSDSDAATTVREALADE